MKIAVIGASGAVGREIISELEDLPLPDLNLVALASPRSQGTSLGFRGKHLIVKAFSLEEVKGCAFVLMSAGSEFSKAHARAIAETSQGVVIDNSSAWRMDPSVPLVVPELNGSLLDKTRFPLIANPNCAAIQVVMTLAALEKRWGLELVMISTYQSVSGTGQKGIDELSQQVRDQLNFTDLVSRVYPQPIAFNVLSAIGPIAQDGYCDEEQKIIAETRKIMDLPHLEVIPTTVRVPIFSCHCAGVTVKLKNPVSYDEVHSAWRDLPGIELAPTRDHLATPLQLAGKSSVSISRIRLMPGAKRSSWLTYWTIADNLKKGAATNAVQIFSTLVGNPT